MSFEKPPVAPIVILSKKNYRLYNGTLGTEYEALREALRTLENRRQALEDEIEELRRRLQLADGHP